MELSWRYSESAFVRTRCENRPGTLAHPKRDPPSQLFLERRFIDVILSSTHVVSLSRAWTPESLIPENDEVLGGL